jgi:glycosyltransferase involved in cell wall biosynthesis
MSELKSKPRTGSTSVMFLGDHFGYPSGVVHGVTTYFLNVLPALQEAGVSLAACFLRDPHPAAVGLIQAGVTPIFLSAHPLDPFVVFRVASIVRKSGCRILHAGGIKATLVARLVGRMVGIPVIVHAHDLTYPHRLMSGLHWVASRPEDVGIAVSRAAQEVMTDGYHVSSGNVRVIHNGLPLDRIRNIAPGTRERVRDTLNIPPAGSVITMVGRMYPVKGHRIMMRTMAIIARTCPGATLLLAGDGPERGACEALADELGIRHQVRFLGNRNDVPELLAASDLLVMPSQPEGLGLAAIEAMALGKPVVAFNWGGLRDVVTDGVDGRLVQPDDQEAFADAVVGLLADNRLLAACGERAAIASERFSLERHVEALVKCYREIAADGLPIHPARA